MLRLCTVILILFTATAQAENIKPVPASLLIAIVQCESGFKHDAIGDDGVSRGLAQFRADTFYEFATMAIKQKRWNFAKLGKPSWMNPLQQMFLLEWGLKNGYGKRWTCYRKIVGK